MICKAGAQFGFFSTVAVLSPSQIQFAARLSFRAAAQEANGPCASSHWRPSRLPGKNRGPRISNRTRVRRVGPGLRALAFGYSHPFAAATAAADERRKSSRCLANLKADETVSSLCVNRVTKYMKGPSAVPSLALMRSMKAVSGHSASSWNRFRNAPRWLKSRSRSFVSTTRGEEGVRLCLLATKPSTSDQVSTCSVGRRLALIPSPSILETPRPSDLLR
jgi:hypothetical protein